MVSGAGQAHLWVFDGERGLLRRRRAATPARWRRSGRRGTRSRCSWTRDTPPPLVDADTVHRDDAQWAQAALAYTQAKQAAQASDEALDRAKEALVALATASPGDRAPA